MYSERSFRRDFWSDDYCGRRIATFHDGDQWHVYLDHRYQHNKVFATAEHARRWLRRRIDTSVRSTRIRARGRSR